MIVHSVFTLIMCLCINGKLNAQIISNESLTFCRAKIRYHVFFRLFSPGVHFQPIEIRPNTKIVETPCLSRANTEVTSTYLAGSRRPNERLFASFRSSLHHSSFSIHFFFCSLKGKTESKGVIEGFFDWKEKITNEKFRVTVFFQHTRVAVVSLAWRVGVFPIHDYHHLLL